MAVLAIFTFPQPNHIAANIAINVDGFSHCPHSVRNITVDIDYPASSHDAAINYAIDGDYYQQPRGRR